jgi:phosphoribosylformylglycinamidine synthase
MYYHKLGESTLSMPIAHAEGRYFIDKEGFNELQDRGQIVFRYQGENPNGSVGGIAGICSPSGRVLGMMPHPERSVSSILHHSEDGLRLLNVFLSSFM